MKYFMISNCKTVWGDLWLMRMVLTMLLGGTVFQPQAGWAVMTNYLTRPITAAGANHCLFVKSDGTVWSWGANSGGQLGYSAVTSYESIPQRVPGILNAVSVAAGFCASYILTGDGSVWVFGDNSTSLNNYPQLGLGQSGWYYSPVKLEGLPPVKSIAAGYRFAFAMLTDGTVMAWGRNDSGQLGINTTQITKCVAATNVYGLRNVAYVAGGHDHALALSNGVVWAWGNNSEGELGLGVSGGTYPCPTQIPNLSGVGAIAAGWDFSMALTTNGAVYTWGSHEQGRLGLGNITHAQTSPSNVVCLSNICQIWAANRQGYALDKDGELWVWGANEGYNSDENYALGLGTNAPAQVLTPTNNPNCGTNVLYICANGWEDGGGPRDHMSLAICADGNLRFWGLAFDSEGTGVVANGTFNDLPSVPVSGMALDYVFPRVGSSVSPAAYYRGCGSNADYASFVLPLDSQKALPLNSSGGSITNQLPFLLSNPIGYHYNLTNAAPGGQCDLSQRIQYQNPIVAFGSRTGGSALYTEQSYRFIVFGGIPAYPDSFASLDSYSNAFQIDVYSKANNTLVDNLSIPIPCIYQTNGAWSDFLTNGLTTTLEAYGLKTTISTREYPFAYGVTNSGVLEVTQEASGAATNYVFVVKVKGMNQFGWVAMDGVGHSVWQPLYTCEFSPAPPWNIRFLSEVQFQGEPLPPFYDGKSLKELTTNSWVVTNTISLPNPMSSYTNLDDSPEFRRHPILDQFVDQMKHNPLALARFVQNEIELTDAVDYFGTNQITAGRLDLGGINRGALGTYLERQGSPTEQCALLIYLLRQAGIPAVYAFPPTNGIKMLDTRLSKMLRVQLSNAMDPYSYAVNTNQFISVNYPWVAAYIDGKWRHFFPWIKDTEIIEGPNLYDFLPDGYDNAMKWVVGYLYSRPEIMGLGETNGSNTPEELFPRYIKQQLLQYAPGLSFEDLGVSAVNRKLDLNRYEDFPTPSWVAGTNLVGESLSDPLVTSDTLRSWNPRVLTTNIFNTVQISISHSTNTTAIISTPELRCCDLHDRQFLFFHERTLTNKDNSAIRSALVLAPFRPGVNGEMAFTNDSKLLAKQVLNYTNATSDKNVDFNLSIKMTRYRPGMPDTSVQRQVATHKGDLNGICLNFGRVTKEMLEPLAQGLWNTERDIKADPSLTNRMSVEDYQGPLVYLMGMAYYEKVNRFMPINERLHRRTPVATACIGLSKLIAERASEGDDDGMPSGPVKFIQPAVDMLFVEQAYVECPTSKPDSGEQINAANSAFELLSSVDMSAKEHDVLNSFFKDSDAVSTVRLLQIGHERFATNSSKFDDILHVDQNNLASAKASVARPDDSIWNKISDAVMGSPESQAYVTAGPVANYTGSYNGTGTLIIDRRGFYQALISGNANGGWGSDFPDDGLFSAPNLANLSLSIDQIGNYSVSYQAPSSSFQPLAGDSFAAFQAFDIMNDALNNLYVYTSYSPQFAYQSSAYLGIGGANYDLSNLFGKDVYATAERGCIGWLSDALSQKWSALHDPVHAVTGEFYVDATDLSLEGPLPLEIRRNYSSLNTEDNEFGIGWKLAFTPYMSVATNGLVMYAAEPDGSALAYEPSQTNAGTVVWAPTLVRNPQLVNNRTQGVGSTANLMLTRIEQRTESGQTNYYLHSPNGDVRFYQEKTFAVETSSNILDRARPYLLRWNDSRGNCLSFSYGTDTNATDYGELNRVDAANGSYAQFRYDVYGHIVEAFTGDGRVIKYLYDEFGDLVTVTLPDASQISYEYEHDSEAVTNKITGKKVITQQPCSLHKLAREIKPDGRELFNVYDDQRRVVIQASTVGADLNLVTNAIFNYQNDFVFTNSFTNTINGSTEVTDVNGKKTLYQYSHSQITNIVDPLNQRVQQMWYADNATPPGYPRSVWKRIDKRGLTTEFQYDASGNVTNVITTGNLTGSGSLEQASSTSRYNANNLPVVVVDEIGNSNVIRYDPTFNFLPQEVVAYKGGQAVTTNRMIYGNISNVVTYGNTTWTNLACGVLQKQIRAFGSGDAATNEWVYDGRGFVTNEIRYTSGQGPAISNLLAYNDRGELYERITPAGHRYEYDHDDLGRIKAEEVYAVGKSTPMSWQYSYYNQNGELTWSDGPRYNPEDYVWRDYDGAGRKIVEAHWRSRAKSDGSGVEALPEDSLYSISTFQYDTFGNLTNSIDPLGNYVAMSYDAVGQMIAKVSYSAAGVPLATNYLAYEPGGQVACVTNALGGRTQTFYTDTGLPCRRLNPDGSTNGWLYYLDGRVSKEFQPNGSYWETVYDDAHLTVKRLFRDASGSFLAGTTNIFDHRGNVLANMTAEGATFFSVFDGLDRVVVSGGPASTGPSVQQVTRTYYDVAGLAVTNEDGAGKRSIALFDPLQRPISVEIRDAGNNNALLWCQSTAYSADFNSVTVTTGTGSGAIRHTTYTDTFGNTVLEQSFPDASTTAFSRSVFDAGGNRVEQWDELGQVTTFAYDGLNRLSTKRLPDQAQINYSYNPEGSIAAMTMPNRMVWSASYNLANQRTGEWLANGAQVTRQFTNHYFLSGPYAGLLRQTVDQGRSIKTTFSYDASLRLSSSSASGPLPEHNVSTVFGYDRQNRLTNYLQSSGVNPTTEIRHAYDGYSQLTNEQVAVYGVFTNSTAQSWSAAGHRSGVISDTARFDYVYRPDGRLAQVSAFGSTYGSYTYGTNGLLDSRSNPWRTVSVLQRDGRGLPLSVSSSVGGASALVETMTWRTNGTLGSYSATRSGSGAWNESRSLGYNARNQLTSESFGLSNNASASAAYAFDADKLGVLTRMALSGGSTNAWVAGAGSPDGLGRIQQEALFQGSTMVRASGAAPGAQQVRGTLDGSSLGALNYDPASSDGRWSVDLSLTSASHTLSVSAIHPSGRYTNTASTSFMVVGSDALGDSYDSAGYVVSRSMAAGTQTMHWDAAGRLVSLSQRNAQAGGYDWRAVYDALGRRLYSAWVPVSNSVALSAQTVSQSSLFDPQVEFQEIAVSLNGVRTWKIFGPDLDGSYGSAQGLGGLEATRQEGAAQPVPVLQDHFGNVLASLNPQGGSVTWSSTRLSGYGPALGYAAPLLSPSLSLAEASVWRGKRIDPSGYYWLGARYYDPVAGRFLSPDPAGHEAAYDLYSFCGGDPVNRFDPTGRFGKEMFQGIQNYKDDVFGDSIVQQMHRQDQILSASSQLVNMVPVIGAGKMFLEMNTMRDMFTGERQDQNQYLQALGIVLNVVPVLTEGMSLASEAGVMPSTGWSSALKTEASAARAELAGSGSTLTGSTGAGKSVVMNVNNAERPVSLESSCFVGGTQVAAEKGFEEIQAIRSGELVWSRNAVTGDWELKPVVRTFSHDYQGEIIALKVGGSVIESTGNHPFWVVEGAGLEERPTGGDVPRETYSSRQPGRWVAARDLRVGDILLNGENGLLRLSECKSRLDHVPVYNIQVADNHNYSVSEQSVLVHNKPASYGSLSSEEVYGTYEGVAAKTTAGSLGEATALQARAQELNGLRDSWMAGRGTTTAVNVRNIGTGEVQTWIATESPGAMPSQWNGLLRNGETFIQGPGHAEQTIANALGNEWVITSGGTSRNICIGTCQPLLKGQGLQLGGPVFRGMGDKTPYRMFWR